MIDLLADDQEYQAEGGQISVILKPLEGKLLMGIKKPAFRRECGVLLHISCLPGGHGIGDLGASARKFIDFLHNSGQKLWQFLPLNPVGPDRSPYYSASAFAGNPLLVSLDQLVADGLLLESELESDLPLNDDVVRFTEVHAYKERLLRYAFARFQSQANCMEYEQFQQENGAWLFDYSLFEAIRKKLGGVWYHWPRDIAQRKKAAIIHSRQLLREEIAFHEFCQYCFFRQMKELKTYAEQREIQLVGDLPIYVCPDSADVWANQQLFELDAQGRPAKVAGVPPDYFSNSGQLWGNPLYRWPIMASDHFAWWRLRFAVLLQQVHRIRLDHFRGFAQYWEVPAGADTAIHGRWVEGPGVEFFHAMEEAFGSLPLILEDLVAMTYEVAELKRNLAYPGMKVLQFSLLNPDAGDFFGCEKNIVLYTGTHDNDTTVGWFHRLLMEQPDQAERIAGLLELKLPQVLPECVCRRLIEKAFASSANTVIIPFQDILALGSEARMNTPGTLDGNWRWRCRTEDFTKTLQLELNQLAARYDR